MTSLFDDVIKNISGISCLLGRVQIVSSIPGSGSWVDDHRRWMNRSILDWVHSRDQSGFKSFIGLHERLSRCRTTTPCHALSSSLDGVSPFRHRRNDKDLLMIDDQSVVLAKVLR